MTVRIDASAAYELLTAANAINVHVQNASLTWQLGAWDLACPAAMVSGRMWGAGWLAFLVIKAAFKQEVPCPDKIDVQPSGSPPVDMPMHAMPKPASREKFRLQGSSTTSCQQCLTTDRIMKLGDTFVLPWWSPVCHRVWSIPQLQFLMLQMAMDKHSLSGISELY